MRENLPDRPRLREECDQPGVAAEDVATGQQIYTRTSFFFICRLLLPGIWGIAALALFAGHGGGPENPLHAMPMFLAQFVPLGLMGLLIAAMLAADMSTDSAYMLTWESVIYNDLLPPFHRAAGRIARACSSTG